jgi:hypothetical protein
MQKINEKDEGKKGLNFKKIANKASKEYGSKEAGERVAGAIRAKLAAKHPKAYSEEVEMTEEDLLAEDGWKYHQYASSEEARDARDAHFAWRSKDGMRNGNPARLLKDGKIAYKGEFRGPKPSKRVSEDTVNEISSELKQRYKKLANASANDLDDKADKASKSGDREKEGNLLDKSFKRRQIAKKVAEETVDEGRTFKDRKDEWAARKSGNLRKALKKNSAVRSASRGKRTVDDKSMAEDK